MRTKTVFLVLLAMMSFATANVDGQIVSKNADAKKWVVQGERAFYNKKDFGEAVRCFTEAIRFEPNNDEVYFYRGLAYGHKGEFDKAIADFTETIRLKPVKSHQAYAYDSRGM